jgi:hypothetical protein
MDGSECLIDSLKPTKRDVELFTGQLINIILTIGVLLKLY